MRSFFPLRGRRPSLAILPVVALPLLAVPTLSARAQPLDWHGEVFFAEPVSGRKVTEYVIDLPVARGQAKTFRIPDECATVMQLVDTGSFYRGSILERHIWQKAESDCRYHRFLNRHPLGEMEDHVTGYDFMNARISDLPIDRRCAHDGPADPELNCSPGDTDAFGLLRHFPVAEPVEADTVEHTGDECRLQNGVFRGRLYVDRHAIHCEADPDIPSLRLIAVDFADVNGDHVLDAVLRFIPIGAGAIRAPLTLPVTRFSDDGPFTVPTMEPPAPPTLE